MGEFPFLLIAGWGSPLGKDPLDRDAIEKFKPITLFNVMFKFFAKVLAKNLALVIDGLFGQAQTCAILTKTIQDNLRLMRNIMD